MSHFLSRAAFESSNCKQLVFQLLVKEFGTESAFEFRDQTRLASISDLKKPVESLAAVLKPNDDEADTAP
jgi:hypothetical protein